MSAVGGHVLTAARRPMARGSASPGWMRRLDLTVPAFMLLAAYGLLRWQTMLPPTMRLRFVGLLALVTVLLVLLRVILRIGDRKVLTAVLSICAVLTVVAMIPMSGFPLRWIVELRVAVTWRAINAAITALPAVTVPYRGASHSVVAVIALGSGLLMVSSALALAGAAGRRSLHQRALAALPLLVLALVPGAIDRPRLQALHGLALFLLLVGFLFAGRGTGKRRGVATLLLMVMVAGSGALAVPAGGALSRGPAWVNLTKLVDGIGPAPVATFDWSQTYGPLAPFGGNGNATVLTVRARFPTYWKAENLDLFNGDGWAALPPAYNYLGLSSELLAHVSRSAAQQWVQQLSFTVGAMKVRHVIAAGVAAYPNVPGLGRSVIPMSSPGTWELSRPLTAGTHYSVDVYTPRPSAKQLAAAAARYPTSITATELTMQLPHSAQNPNFPEVQFASYRPGNPDVIGGSAPAPLLNQQLLLDSPFAGVYRLATTLEAKTRTPYGYVQAVMRYLRHGYRYTKQPPKTKYPIPGFLLDTKAGYCQQFAGAMALLLRMGGVPARVAVGFTTGTHDAARDRYLVTSQDAHAWVEVWFPNYGWVPFDPTPAGNQSSSALPVDAVHRQFTPGSTSGNTGGSSSSVKTPAILKTTSVRGHVLPVSTLTVLAVLTGLVGLLSLWYTRVRRRLLGPRPAPSSHALVREVERAFARCGRPVSPSTTLSALEARVAASDHIAAEYVRRLRLARFGDGDDLPTQLQRRALRAWLAAGRGPSGRLRALFALPPRRLD